MASSLTSLAPGSSNIIRVLMYSEIPIDDLQRHFCTFGSIVEIKQPYYVPDPKRCHDCETYITYQTSSAAIHAHQMSDCLAGGYRVQVYLHKGAVPQPMFGICYPDSNVPRPNTVKVSIMKGQPTGSELQQIFSQYGELFPRPISILGDTQKYAYINFKDPDNAKRAALTVNNKPYPNGWLLYARLHKRITAQLVQPRHNGVSTIVALPSLRFTSIAASGAVCQWPATWDLTGNPQDVLFDVQNCGSEWNGVSLLFDKTMPHATLLSIKRIQNENLYKEYQHKMDTMQDDRTKKLFHGSGKTLPEKIYNHQSKFGFDFRYCDNGLWGRGAYFAKNASFSNSYCFKDPSGHRQIFLATVLTGETCWMDEEDRTLKMPPPHPHPPKTYDSVGAYHPGGSDIFVVYEHYTSYPTYLITYTV